MKLKILIRHFILLLLFCPALAHSESAVDAFDTTNDLGRRMAYYYLKLSKGVWKETYEVLSPEIKTQLSLAKYIHLMDKKYKHSFPISNGRFEIADEYFLGGGRGWIYFIILKDNADKKSRLTRRFHFRDIWVLDGNNIYVVPKDFYQLDYKITIKSSE